MFEKLFGNALMLLTLSNHSPPPPVFDSLISPACLSGMYMVGESSHCFVNPKMSGGGVAARAKSLFDFLTCLFSCLAPQWRVNEYFIATLLCGS